MLWSDVAVPVSSALMTAACASILCCSWNDTSVD